MALSASEPNPQLVARRKFRRDVVDDCMECFMAFSFSSTASREAAAVHVCGRQSAESMAHMNT
jgi:hypothetical protein